MKTVELPEAFRAAVVNALNHQVGSFYVYHDIIHDTLANAPTAVNSVCGLQAYNISIDVDALANEAYAQTNALAFSTVLARASNSLYDAHTKLTTPPIFASTFLLNFGSFVDPTTNVQVTMQAPPAHSYPTRRALPRLLLPKLSLRPRLLFKGPRALCGAALGQPRDSTLL